MNLLQAQAQSLYPAGSRPLLRQHHRCDGPSTKNVRQNRYIFGFKTTWKLQEMGNVKHKGNIFYLTVLLFLMTFIQASNLCDSILWEVCPMKSKKYILWDIQSQSRKKTGATKQVLPQILQNWVRSICQPIFPQFLHLEKWWQYNFPPNRKFIKASEESTGPLAWALSMEEIGVQ